MEKYARQAVSEGVKGADDLHVSADSEIYRVLNLHYNRNNHIEVCRNQVRYIMEQHNNNTSASALLYAQALDPFDHPTCRMIFKDTNSFPYFPLPVPAPKPKICLPPTYNFNSLPPKQMKCHLLIRPLRKCPILFRFIQVPQNFRFVIEQTLREFFRAIQTGKDTEQSWKKSIYKVISRMDDPVPEYFKSPNFLEQLE